MTPAYTSAPLLQKTFIRLRNNDISKKLLLNMASTIRAECPNCEWVEDDVDGITRVFGWRWVPNKNDPNKKRIPQSWCKRCRDAEKFSVIGKGSGR